MGAVSSTPSPPEAPSLATLTVMRGEVERLPALLATLAWCEERHMVDTSLSPTKAPELSSFVFHHHPLPAGASFDAARAAATPAIRANWVLVVDTDEQVPESLVAHLRERLAQWEREGVEGVWLPRRNHVLGHTLEHSSAWPDYQLRLIRRSKLAFSDTIHAGMPKLERTERLPAQAALALQHHSFESTTEFAEKINVYSRIEADQKPNPGASPTKAALAFLRTFVARYVRQKGFRDGQAGLHYAMMMSFYRYLVVSKQWEPSAREPRSKP